MKVQEAAANGWTIVADFGHALAVALAAGVFFSLLAGLVVFVVSTVN